MTNVYDTLKSRGFLQQVTDEKAVRSLFETERVTAYTGYDPTAESLHVGNLLTIMPLMHLERAGHRPLAVVGSVAPLVGLLGTVFGMIFAFRSASQEGLGKAEVLAEGIYLALWTTAAGLTIAIPSLLFVAWFNSSVERFMRDIDETLLETMPSFTRMENSKVVAPPPVEPATAT